MTASGPVLIPDPTQQCRTQRTEETLMGFRAFLQKRINAVNNRSRYSRIPYRTSNRAVAKQCTKNWVRPKITHPSITAWPFKNVQRFKVLSCGYVLYIMVNTSLDTPTAPFALCRVGYREKLSRTTPESDEGPLRCSPQAVTRADPHNGTPAQCSNWPTVKMHLGDKILLLEAGLSAAPAGGV